VAFGIGSSSLTISAAVMTRALRAPRPMHG
jgi:hypothetical protein